MLRRELLRWYDANARELPWRGSVDPYAIWVSEIMCQQTRVDTVRNYYAAWMQRFPTIDALAAASADEVMSMWAGLGYYRRARSLHQAAQELARDRGGAVPTTHRELRELPGVGDYTAGAIASIAYGETVPAVDGNVTRVVSRLRAIDGDPSRAAFRRAIRSSAAELVDPQRPGDFNQALMELGALVCSPRSPSCEVCPVQELCAARRADTVSEYPPSATRTRPRLETRDVVVNVRGDAAWVQKQLGDGLLGGTWVFPPLERDLLPRPDSTAFIGEFEHVFSHIRMTYRVHVRQQPCGDPTSGEGRWVPWKGLADLGISTAMRRVADLVIESARE